MLLGRVIGTIWATRKDINLAGFRLLIVQPLNSGLQNVGSPVIATDTIGAGNGELIYYATSSEAVIPMKVDMAPVDASIVGIVDHLNN